MNAITHPDQLADNELGRRLFRLTLALLLLVFVTPLVACGTEDIPPGHKGFLFDRTGALAFYTGGGGLETDTLLGPGTHFTGIYDEVRDVNCTDAHAKEAVDVLTKSDLTVKVDLRITYSADCSTPESVLKILDTVEATDGTVQPEALYDRYILAVIRASLRNALAGVTIEDVKKVRTEIRDSVTKDLNDSLATHEQPVIVKILQVSNIVLPAEITEKNKKIELARQDAEQEREKQKAAQVRLERELFEAQQNRKVQVEQAAKEAEVAEIAAERDKKVAILNAEAGLEAKKKEAEGVAALRQELTADYLKYLKLIKDAEVKKATADAMSNGTVWYVGQDFLIPPGSDANVAVSR